MLVLFHSRTSTPDNLIMLSIKDHQDDVRNRARPIFIPFHCEDGAKGKNRKKKAKKGYNKKNVKKAKVIISWLFGFLISRFSLMVFSGFFWGIFSYFLSFPLFLWSKIQKFWGQNKNSGEEVY